MGSGKKHSTIVAHVVSDIIGEIEAINAAWKKDYSDGQSLIHYSTQGNDDSTLIKLKCDSNFDKDHFTDAVDGIDEMLETEGYLNGVLPVHITRVRFGDQASFRVFMQKLNESRNILHPFAQKLFTMFQHSEEHEYEERALRRPYNVTLHLRGDSPQFKFMAPQRIDMTNAMNRFRKLVNPILAKDDVLKMELHSSAPGGVVGTITLSLE